MSGWFKRASVAAFALALLSIASASANAALINFEDLSPPPSGLDGTGTVVDDEYDPIGVNFAGLTAFNFATGPEADPGFPHSPSNAGLACVGVEVFVCSTPITITFNQAQQSVSVWAGHRALPRTADIPVRLTAFNAAGAQVGMDERALTKNQFGTTQIRTQLSVATPTAVIVKVVLTVVEPNAATVDNLGLGIDDVEFTSVGPPTPCPTEVGKPNIALFRPSLDGPPTQLNRFVLEGESFPTPGAPTRAATLVVRGPDRTERTLSIHPGMIDRDGGKFGPTTFHDLLFPGRNEVFIRAENCNGSSTSNPGDVTYEPIPAGASFRTLGGIEVAQVVQTPQNSVPLIAPSANGVKRTFARVPLDVEGAPGGISHVSGSLIGFRADGTPLGILNSLATVDHIAENTTLATARTGLRNSLTFELPVDWMNVGPIHLELAQIRVGGTATSLSCTGCRNLLPTGGPRMVRFYDAPPIRVMFVLVPWKPDSNSPTNFVGQFHLDMATSQLRRMFPTADLRIDVVGFEFRIGRPTCTQINNELATLRSRFPMNSRTYLYGIIPDGDTTGMPTFPDGKAGCARSGTRNASGNTGMATSGTDTDGSYGDLVAVHEIGHNMGRRHVAGCSEPENTDGSYPFSGGLIGNATIDAVGVDTGDADLGVAPQAIDWRNDASDIMTYCHTESKPLWVSPYTYEGMLARSCSDVASGCPGIQLSRETRPRPSGGRRLSIVGTLAPRTSRVLLEPMAVLDALPLTKRPARSKFKILLRGAGGKLLATYPFRPKRDSENPDGKRAITETVPFKPAAQRIEIVKGKRVLKVVRVSDHAPTLRIVSPSGGANLTGRVDVNWQGKDADGDKLSYTLLYSPRAGRRSWLPVADGLRRTSYSVDVSRLPGGGNARFKVVATDGVLTDTSTIVGLAVPVKPPRVSITSLTDGATVSAGDVVTLAANALDPQGQLNGSDISWHSSLQGPLGAGFAISAPLQAGAHEITVTATNGAGVSSSKAITVTASTPPPDFVPQSP